MKRIAAIMLFLAMILPLHATGIPQKSTILKGYDILSAKQRFQERAIDRIEGLWYYPEEEMTVAIEKNDSETIYRVVVVEAADCSIDCGSIAGYMEKTAADDKFRLWLYSAIENGVTTNPIESVATLSDHGKTLLIDRPEIKFRFSINLTQFLPSIFNLKGIRIYPKRIKPEIKPGFRKTYPDNENSQPVYF